MENLGSIGGYLSGVLALAWTAFKWGMSRMSSQEEKIKKLESAAIQTQIIELKSSYKSISLEVKQIRVEVQVIKEHMISGHAKIEGKVDRVDEHVSKIDIVLERITTHIEASRLTETSIGEGAYRVSKKKS